VGGRLDVLGVFADFDAEALVDAGDLGMRREENALFYLTFTKID